MTERDSVIEREFQEFADRFKGVLEGDARHVVRAAFHTGGLACFVAVSTLLQDDDISAEQFFELMKQRKAEYLAFDAELKAGRA